MEVGEVEVGEVLTILTHTSPQIAPPSGGWEDKGRNEKLAIYSDDMCQTGAHHHIIKTYRLAGPGQAGVSGLSETTKHFIQTFSETVYLQIFEPKTYSFTVAREKPAISGFICSGAG